MKKEEIAYPRQCRMIVQKIAPQVPNCPRRACLPDRPGEHAQLLSSFLSQNPCQEIGLVAFMFFFELLFSYVSSQFPSMFLLLTHSQSFFSLSADYPKHSRRRRCQISILLIQDKYKNHFAT